MSRCSLDNHITSTSPSMQYASTSAFCITSSLCERGGENGEAHLSATGRAPMVDASLFRQQAASPSSPRSRLPTSTAKAHLTGRGSLKRAVGGTRFWPQHDQYQHITWNEMKAARLTVISFLSLLRGQKIFVHEDNQALVAVLSHLTSRSPDITHELKILLELSDTNIINIHARYTRSAANVS
jgi:hypothetical protein